MRQLSALYLMIVKWLQSHIPISPLQLQLRDKKHGQVTVILLTTGTTQLWINGMHTCRKLFYSSTDIFSISVAGLLKDRFLKGFYCNCCLFHHTTAREAMLLDLMKNYLWGVFISLCASTCRQIEAIYFDPSDGKWIRWLAVFSMKRWGKAINL